MGTANWIEKVIACSAAMGQAANDSHPQEDRFDDVAVPAVFSRYEYSLYMNDLFSMHVRDEISLEEFCSRTKAFKAKNAGFEPKDPIVTLQKELRRSDTLSRKVRIARKLGLRVDDLAEYKNIPLRGHSWVDPAPLDPHAGRLTKLFNTMSASDAYQQWQIEKRQKLVQTLTAREKFCKAARGWVDMPRNKRAEILRMIVSAHEGIYGDGLFEPAGYQFNFYQEARPREKGARLVRGTFSRGMTGQYNMSINDHPDARFDEFAVALDVIHHEATHGVQQSFGDLYANGEIESNHPFYEDARYWFMTKNERRSYITGISSIYRAHPIETDAFSQGAHFAAEIIGTLADKGITPRKQRPSLKP